MTERAALAIIGGSGLYAMPGLEQTKTYEMTTPFGPPSAPIVIGTLEGKRVAFLARHGVGHHILPSELNSRANIFALKSLGVEQVVAISACGSLREDYAPGEIVVPDQLFDNTRNRPMTFFGDGLVAHISVAEPFCRRLSSVVGAATIASGATVHMGGAYVTIEGPRFSTKAESQVYRLWGMSIVGMTTSPEAILAREAEMCYAVMAHVTDYDVWHESEEPVTADMVFKTIGKNLEVAQKSIRKIVKNIDEDRPCECKHALATALTTHREAINPETQEKLSLLIDKYIK